MLFTGMSGCCPRVVGVELDGKNLNLILQRYACTNNALKTGSAVRGCYEKPFYLAKNLAGSVLRFFRRLDAESQDLLCRCLRLTVLIGSH
ncbi:MAG: hypothetical protein CTY16_12630 [Methylobacter sp.]|nr:MAG: hypothetical protein CTY16_12630 [Methylobacter sp.]